MRKLIIAASLLAFAFPAAAQMPYEDYTDIPPASQRDGDLPPAAQRDADMPPAARHAPSAGALGAMGGRVTGMADALMDTDIGPAADAIAPGRRHRYRTLGELASHGDPYARERMHRSIETSTARLSAMARELAIVTPMLMRSLQDAQMRLRGAMNGYTPSGEVYRDGPAAGARPIGAPTPIR